MSDADDQLGGTGGERGPRPGEDQPAAPTPQPSQPSEPVGEEQARKNREDDPPS